MFIEPHCHLGREVEEEELPLSNSCSNWAQNSTDAAHVLAVRKREELKDGGETEKDDINHSLFYGTVPPILAL